MYNAGVLLYSIRNGDVVFLLGKDAKWRQWSDFGGKNDINDKNKEDTAVREFYEESVGTIFDMIQIKDRIKCCQCIKTLSYKKHDYYMYLMKIDYSEKYIDLFQSMVYFNLNIPKKFQEKTEIKWFTLQHIIDNYYEMRSVFYKTIIKDHTVFINLK